MAHKRAPLQLNELSNLLRRKRNEAQLYIDAGDEIEHIGSLARAGDEAEKRYATITASVDAKRAELADAQAAKDQAIRDATTEAERIVAQAKADGDAIREKARADAAAELAGTNRELEAARLELSGLNDRIGKARQALSA